MSVPSYAGAYPQDEITNRMGKQRSWVVDRRAARAGAQSTPPYSFYLAIEPAGFSAKDNAGKLAHASTKFEQAHQR